MDKDTEKLVVEGGQFSDLVSHPAWSLVKKRLNEIFVEIDSWSTLPKGLNQTQKFKEMEARERAIEIVQRWVADIEGIADQGIETRKTISIDRKATAGVYLYLPETEQRTEKIS